MVSILFVCLVGLAVGNNAADIPTKILKQINTWSLLERCFGETKQLEISLGLQKATEFCKATPPGKHGLVFPENAKHFFPERISMNQIQDDSKEILKGLIQFLTRNKRQLEEDSSDAEGEDEEVAEETEDTIEESKDEVEETEDVIEEVLEAVEKTEDKDGEGGTAAEVEDIEDAVEDKDTTEKQESEVDEEEITIEKTKDDVEEGGSAAEVGDVKGAIEDQQSIEFDEAATTGLLNPNDSDFEDFASKLKYWQSGLSLKMSNLTCVLTKLGLLDSEGLPDLERLAQFTNLDSNDVLSIGSTHDSAVADPEFRQMMTNSYEDCQAIADGWPREVLGRNWLGEKNGRNVVFFRCVKKAVVGNCGKWEVSRALEVWYGKDKSRMEQDGLAGNKFDAAVIAIRVLYDAATPEEAFVQDFFWGKD